MNLNRYCKILLTVIATTISFSVFAQTGPYWATDVAPILYANCTSCHHPNGIAPFSLITYGDAVTEAGNIKVEVTNRRMPPWPPDTGYTRFMHERVLNATEIQTISDWVDNGVQQGNLSQAPTPPVYTNTAVIPNPDFIGQIPTFTVNAATDLYRCFVIPTGLTQDTYISKVEVIPGNSNIVHHVLIMQDTSSACDSLDLADPGPGYTSNGGGIGSSTATGIVAWGPGQSPFMLPQGFGIKLLANSKLIIQMHYPAATFGQLDSTQVRLVFDNGATREVHVNPLISHTNDLINGPLIIPPNTTPTFYAHTVNALNSSLLTIMPHMHLIGKQISCYAVDTLGDTIPMISVPEWSFHWQGLYHYQVLTHIPAGSDIYAQAYYDNTSANPNNPNSPPVEILAGESTTEEMLIIYISYVDYLPGDETMIIDSSLVSNGPELVSSIVQTPQLYNPYPVPANESPLQVNYFLPQAGAVNLELVDANGKVVWHVNTGRVGAGFNAATIPTRDLAKGTYILRLTSDGVTRSKTVIL